MTEVIHSMLEEGPTVCERCGGELRRVIYPSGIIFKGSGFYRTDSRNGGSTSSSTTSSTEGTAGSTTEKTAGSTSETTAKGTDAGNS